ncbi:hypothetical protein GGI21_001993 [Coemansia aciculifera]|nr:hypothetical protein GGI21_001993 [Coemansia aciculifera]
MCNDKDDDDNDECHKESKWLQTASGAVVRPRGDGEPNVSSKHTSAGHVSQAKKEHVHHDRPLSDMYDKITCWYSASLFLIDNDDVSSDDDEDCDALTAKVLLSKIRGGELIGLSPHLPTLSKSTSSSVWPRTIHCTGFGSNWVPIPIFSELEPEAAVEAPTVAAVTAPTVAAVTAPTVMAASALASVTSATTAPSLSAITKTSGSAEPDSVSKSEIEEMAADATDYSSKVATALTMLTTPMMPMLSPASVSAASNALLVKVLDIAHRMSMAPSGVFSVQLVTSAMTNATGAAMGTAMPELVPKAVTSVPTFSFGLSKPAADLASKPVVTSGLFSFGAAATLNTTTMSAVVAGDKPKSEFKFSFGSLGTTSTAGTQATSAAAGQPAQQMTFGQICASASTASRKAPTILTAKQPCDNEASGSDMPAASKPKFSFGSSSATGSGFSLASLASSAPAFGSQSFNFTTNPAFTLLTVNSTMPASSKPVSTFTFGSTATSATTPSGAGGGAEFTFTFGCATNNVPATSTSVFNFGSPFGGSSAAKPTAAPALTAFGGFGKGTMTSVPGTAANTPVFLFGSAALGMPAVLPFVSMSIAMPAATTYANPAASATTPACGAAMLSASGFGSGPVAWPTTTPFANPATSATTPACGAPMPSASGFGSGFGNMSNSLTRSSGSAFGSSNYNGGFGATRPLQAITKAFGSSNGRLGFESNAEPMDVSSDSYTVDTSLSSTGFCESLTSTSEFGQQQQQQQSNTSAMFPFSNHPGDLGSSVGNTSAFVTGTTSPQYSFSQSYPTQSTAGLGFNASAFAPGSVPPTSFAFNGNPSVQAGSMQPSQLQFTSGGVIQHPSTGFSGHMSMSSMIGSAASNSRRFKARLHRRR